MKEGIHPKYEKTVIRCACGEVIETGSTKENIRVDICSKCRSLQVSRSSLIPADALIVSTSVSILTTTNKSKMSGAFCAPLCLCF